MPDTRGEYEKLVRGLAALAAELKAKALEPEAIARTLHSARQALAMKFKAATSEPMKSHIRDRTLRVYGNDVGPSIDFLRAHGKSWEQIIASAVRPGRMPAAGPALAQSRDAATAQRLTQPGGHSKALPDRHSAHLANRAVGKNEPRSNRRKEPR
jgi:hypothetical protein